VFSRAAVQETGPTQRVTKCARSIISATRARGRGRAKSDGCADNEEDDEFRKEFGMRVAPSVPLFLG
jgi:hypothetical protein